MFKKFTLSLAMVFCAVNLNGCMFLLIPVAIGVAGGVGIGIGTAKWMSDKLVEQVPQTYAKTVQGVHDGLKGLKIDIIKETDTDTLTQISCKYSDGRTVWINIANVSAKVSRIEVRVGVWGGQKEARVILDGILAHL
jgi:Protein of unknown function (DUF3568)